MLPVCQAAWHPEKSLYKFFLGHFEKGGTPSLLDSTSPFFGSELGEGFGGHFRGENDEGSEIRRDPPP